MASVWTDKQLDAITAKDTAVIVSAAAGSGKTSVLIERLLRQLSDTENKMPADRIVVVTFTNDAAAQMKKRLSAQLSALIEKQPDNMWLYQQQSLIQSAKISTIHSFCFDLIRDNIQMLDISSGFRILDDTEETIIRTKALSEVLEKFCKSKSEMMTRLNEFFCGAKRDDSVLSGIVLSLYNFLMSLPFYSDWLDSQKKRYSNGFQPEHDSFAPQYLAVLGSLYKDLAFSAKACINMCEWIDAPKALDTVTDDYNFFMKLYNSAGNTSEDWDDRVSGVPSDFGRLTFPKGISQGSDAETVEKIKSIRDKYKKKYNKIKDEMLFSYDDICDDYNRHKEIINYLAELVLAVDEEIKKAKLKKNALGFSDAEQLTIKLLAEKDENGNIIKTPLAKELSDYYKIIMIDEYQDSNNTQDLIFKLISHNGTALTAGDNLFAVGDIKQSIYRFRLANPQIFIDSLNSATKYTADYKGKNASVLLNKNFRSSNDVVWFVNYIFSHIMSKDVGDIEYSEDEKLVQGATFTDNDRTTEVIIVPEENDDENDNEDENNSEYSGVIKESIEAKAVAEKINSMLYKKEVQDKDIMRPCEPKDFCILLRDKARATSYIEELSKYGIKACADEAEGYLKSREISVLMNLLTVTDNPLQDIPLVSVLMSPMFMISADEIAEIRMLSADRKEPLFKAVLSASGSNSENKQINASYYPKLVNFLEVLQKLRYCSASQSLERLIRTAYDSTDFLSVVQVYKDGEQKKANLRLLLQYAKSYDENSKGGLSGFIRYMNNIFDENCDLKKAGTVSSSDNVISIMTIHKSKGLEFPFVFLCGTSKKFNTQDQNNRMQINADMGIGFKIQDFSTLRYYNSFPHTVIKMQNSKNSKSEEMRLLYVALTRAKEQLFITVKKNDNTIAKAQEFALHLSQSEKVTPQLSASAQSMQDWLVMALLSHADCNNIRSMAQYYEAPDNKGGKIKETIYEDNHNTAEIKEKIILADDEIVKQLEKNFAYKYDDTLSKLTAKLSVTEIVREVNENELYLKIPQFVSDKTKLKGAEAGTAVHTFMQYCNFDIAENNVLQEINAMYENGIITQNQKSSILDNTSSINTFFDSDIYKRIKNSSDVRREFKFLTEISELSLDDSFGNVYNNTNGMLQGIADCIFEEAGELVLIDYKTDKLFYENAYIDKYKLQLSLYSKAISLIFKKAVKEAYVYSFSMNKAIKII